MCCVASKHVHVQRCSRIAPKAIERETAKWLWHGFVKQFPSCGVRRTVQFVNLKSMDHTHTAPTHTGRPEALLITGFCLKSASGHGWTECIDVEDDYIERLLRGDFFMRFVYLKLSISKLLHHYSKMLRSLMVTVNIYIYIYTVSQKNKTPNS